MVDVQLIRGTTLEYIDQMSNRMREEERVDFQNHYDSVWEGLIECCLLSSDQLTTVLIEGELAAIYGLRDGQPWMALATHATKYPVTAFKLAKRQVELWDITVGEMKNAVPDEDEDAKRFLERVGFTLGEETNGMREFRRCV